MPPRIRRRITSAKREEIEKRQNEISQSIVRPFEVYSGLPVSFNAPSGQYEELFKHPLTAKDSGILYLSLMKSRYNYVFICPMFKLYWIKQSSYAKKLAEQDKPLPKSSNDDNLTGRQPVLGSEVSARDAMAKLCDSSMSIGPHHFEIRLFIGKDERSEKTLKKGSQSNLEKPKKENHDKMNKEEAEIPAISQSLDYSEKVKETKVEKIDTVAVEAPIESAKVIPSVISSNMTAKNGVTEDKVQDKRESHSGTEEGSEVTDAPGIQSQIQTQSHTSAEGSSQLPTRNSSKSPPTPQTMMVDPNNMQSIDNTIMISNLNAIARTDHSLNSLMKVVASGNATPQEILKFQGYIKRAREMGPQAHHAYLFDQMGNPMLMGQRMDINEQLKERKAKEKKIPKSRLPKDQKLTAFQEKYLNNAKILFEYVENPNIRFLLPQKSICEVTVPTVELSEEDKEEENSERRDILISTLWIHNQNEIDEYEEQLKKYDDFMKPEKNENEEDEQEKNGADEGKEHEEIPTVAENESAAQEGESLEEGKELVTEATTEDQTHYSQADDLQADNTEKISKPAKKPPPRKARRKGRLTRKATNKKKVTKPEEPEVRFTALSFTVHNIPLRFVPIIVNSFEPVKNVQEYMQGILTKGNRLANYYLWYQVDGKLDEQLAESIRIQLNQQEKKMQGISTVGTAAKKRKMKEKSETTKKPKIEKPKEEKGTLEALHTSQST